MYNVGLCAFDNFGVELHQKRSGVVQIDVLMCVLEGGDRNAMTVAMRRGGMSGLQVEWSAR